MGGRKRVSNQSDDRPVRRKSSGSLETAPDVSKAFVLFPPLKKAIDIFESWWQEHQDVEGIMKALWPDGESQQAWVMKLDGLFPPQDGVQYLQAQWGDHGLKNLRPWHWGWTKARGNKGTVTKENFLYLLQSVMAKGFVTDALEAGIELPEGKDEIDINRGNLDLPKLCFRADIENSQTVPLLLRFLAQITYALNPDS